MTCKMQARRFLSSKSISFCFYASRSFRTFKTTTTLKTTTTTTSIESTILNLGRLLHTSKSPLLNCIDVKESTGEFKNDRGDKIFYRQWNSLSHLPKKAIVLMTHGFGEHSGRMKHIGESFAKEGYTVAAHDHVGHGLSDGRRGYVDTADHYVDDIVEMAAVKQKESPSLPIFILGHSMGSHMAIRTVLFYPDLFRGVISSAAPLTINKRMITPTKYLLAQVAARLMPYYVVAVFDNSKMSRDPSVMKDREKDDLCYRGGMTAKWAQALYHSLVYVINNMEGVRTPILAIHGSHDVVCETKGSVDLVERASSKDKTLKIYDGAYHSLFFEPGIAEQAIKDCIEWTEARL